MKRYLRFVRDILFWVLMALAIGTFILDTQLRRLPGESYAPAAFFINQREMERGVFLSAFMYILFGQPRLGVISLVGFGGCRAVVSHLFGGCAPAAALGNESGPSSQSGCPPTSSPTAT